MPDKNLMEITISRIIHAGKWRVIRQLIKVEKFPTYIPTIKEVSIIQRSHRRTKIRWHIQVDKVPITWVEEDSIAFAKSAICFRAIEGDLEEFSGEWLFKDHPEGTEVIVNINLKVGILLFKDFADAYVKNIVIKNFEAILDAVERRLISVRYAGYKRGDIDKIAGFAMIGHPYNYNHLEKYHNILNPNAKIPSRDFLGNLFGISPSFKLYDILNFKSKTGQVTNGCFIIATFIPDMMEMDKWAIFSKVVRACKLAEKHGIGIVTLGGFTSIVGERIGQQISGEVDVPITTGNTFTAAMAIDGVIKASRLLNVDIQNSKVAVIGGTGDIGSACARVFVDKVRQLTITGRTKINLKRMAKELVKKRKAKIIATTDNEAAVRDADIVIAAASVSASILKIDWFKPGAIICDVGYPKNVSYMPTDRKDILIFSGGLAKSPTLLRLPIDVGLPALDTIYGCFAEAIILALEKRFENFSFGRGNITVERINEIRDLGKKHGFEVSDFYWGDRLIDEKEIAQIKNNIKCLRSESISSSPLS